MSQNVFIRRIRPYLFTSYRRVHPTPTTHRVLSTTTVIKSTQENAAPQQEERKVTHDYERRVSQLQSISPPGQWYPRIHQSRDTQTRIMQFKRKHQYLQDGETNEDITVTVTGMFNNLPT
jgi:lysyl-tRNA synthetase class 2